MSKVSLNSIEMAIAVLIKELSDEGKISVTDIINSLGIVPMDVVVIVQSKRTKYVDVKNAICNTGAVFMPVGKRKVKYIMSKLEKDGIEVRCDRSRVNGKDGYIIVRQE